MVCLVNLTSTPGHDLEPGTWQLMNRGEREGVAWVLRIQHILDASNS